ncbi:hypothetical protein KFK09_014049 [Dendrobium nobile]|uniref:F-box domain-containing protein n=1 Tax=Dendrobium nobile TaxID=94219 RepID=A0A8T3BAX3_DENNO|nr:hypothetical protein KFK09_014049 [Dendrobium nobile]
MKMSFSKMNNSNISSYTKTNGIDLIDDLLMEIFTKLPVKSIYRCRCVSRSWRRLADRCIAVGLPLVFCAMFYRSGPRDIDLEPRYGCNCNGSFQETDFSYLPFYHNSNIIDWNNSLLLFYRRISFDFYVCNPTTKKWAALPKPRGESQHSILAFDAYESPYYKVVCFSSGCQAQVGQLEVFSSETDQWVEHSLNWGVNSSHLTSWMHYFDGVIYVLAYPRHVACIDLEKMCSSVIEFPDDIENVASLGNSGGFLHCAINDANELRIWVLKGIEWMLKNIVSVSDILEWKGDCIYTSPLASLVQGQFKFLAFHPKEDVVFLWVMGNLMSYDLCKKIFDFVCELGTEKEKVLVNHIWLFF